MRAGIDLLTRRNAEPGSIFHNRVDLEHIGASGHSQGARQFPVKRHLRRATRDHGRGEVTDPGSRPGV